MMCDVLYYISLSFSFLPRHLLLFLFLSLAKGLLFHLLYLEVNLQEFLFQLFYPNTFEDKQEVLVFTNFAISCRFKIINTFFTYIYPILIYFFFDKELHNLLVLYLIGIGCSKPNCIKNEFFLSGLYIFCLFLAFFIQLLF